MKFIWYYHKKDTYKNIYDQEIDLGQSGNSSGIFYQSPFATSMYLISTQTTADSILYPQSSTNKANAKLSLKIGERGIINPLWQYNETCDPRDVNIKNSSINGYGRVYNQRIRPNDPIVFIQPGKPKFYGLGNNLFSGNLMGSKNDKLRSAIANSWSSDSDAFGGSFGISDLMKEFAWRTGNEGNPTKFYDFDPDFRSYSTYVKNLCLELMVRMGINQAAGFESMKTSGTGDSLKAMWNTAKLAENNIFRKFMDYYDYWNQSDTLNASSGNADRKIQASFLPFRVEKSTDASDGFGNETGAASAAEFIRSKTDTAKEINFLTSGGYGNGGGISGNVANTAQKIAKYTENMAAGVASGVSQSAETIIKTGGNILFPDIWKDSNYSKSLTLNIKLHAPYGSLKCYFENIIFPLACLLALAMPRQTDSAVYISPPLVRLYSKGWLSCDMGMVESLSIRRGADRNDWTINRLPRTVEVSLSIKDLFGTMMMSMGGSVGKNLNIFNERNTELRDYLNVLGGVDAFSDSSFSTRCKQKLEYMMAQIQKYADPQWWIGTLQSTPISRIGSKFHIEFFGGNHK